MNPGSPDTPVIRTPDQRLRVFVSSTPGELADERRTAAEAISALGLTPVILEQKSCIYPRHSWPPMCATKSALPRSPPEIAGSPARGRPAG